MLKFILHNGHNYLFCFSPQPPKLYFLLSVDFRRREDAFAPLARRQVGAPVRGLVDGADHVPVVAIVSETRVKQARTATLPAIIPKANSCKSRFPNIE